MVLLLLVVLAAAPVIAVPANKAILHYNVAERDYDYLDRIIGGDRATIEEFPYLVSLFIKYLHNEENTTFMYSTCGGTILTPDWVLTAAHCVKNRFSNTAPEIDVRGGSIYQFSGGVVRHAKEIVTDELPKHDIALIKIDEPCPLNGITITAARLPRQDEPVPVGSTGTIMGWGDIDVAGTPAETLMKQEVVVISHVFCWFSYFWTFNFITEYELCTLFDPKKSPAGTYKGDSGSPVVVNGQVVGIVSWGSVFFLLPDVRTRVSSYIDWIEKHVGPLPRSKS